MAEADVYLGRAFHTRHYGYWKYTYDLMGVGVAMAKDETYKKFSRYASSTFYSKLSKNRAKRDLRDRVATKMGMKMHTSRAVAIEQFPYFEIMFQPEDVARDLADYFELDDAEVKQFRKRKIKNRKTKKVSEAKSKGKTKAVPKKSSKKASNETKPVSSKKGSKDVKPEKGSKNVKPEKSSKDVKSEKIVEDSKSEDKSGEGKKNKTRKKRTNSSKAASPDNGDSGKSESKDNGKQVSLFSFK
ncbi:hypothetical protein GCM10025861_24580 [Methanobacterium petrolearium]|nr:hypothetical protein GCM10025861_24580 [Methanobacterium petrolearium]